MIKNSIHIVLFFAMVHLNACKDGNDEPSASNVKVDMLTAQPWGQAIVTHATDGDLSDEYSDFAITFTSNPSAGFQGTYVAANGGHAFADATGKWKFNEEQTLIVLDSGREIEFELNETQLKLDFTVLGSGGRSNGLSGHFTFELQPL